jgi:tRNA (guanine37-N1)-methyltransferase
MNFHILTLFPEMFVGPLSESIIKRAQEKRLINISYYNIRDYAEDKHKTVDDTPYGGGKGMVMKVETIDRALEDAKSKINNYSKENTQIILLTPQGETFNQDKAVELSKYENIILIAGHYEGFDERVRQYLVDKKISIGEYVLTGGELPAMVLIDAISRMVPGVLAEGSATEETFMRKNEKGEYLKEYPQYTKPAEYKGWKVPEVLLSGNHQEIEKWRKEQSKNKLN